MQPALPICSLQHMGASLGHAERGTTAAAFQAPEALTFSSGLSKSCQDPWARLCLVSRGGTDSVARPSAPQPVGAGRRRVRPGAHVRGAAGLPPGRGGRSRALHRAGGPPHRRPGAAAGAPADARLRMLCPSAARGRTPQLTACSCRACPACAPWLAAAWSRQLCPPPEPGWKLAGLGCPCIWLCLCAPATPACLAVLCRRSRCGWPPFFCASLWALLLATSMGAW